MPETLFKMPSLGADMDEGLLVEWLRQPGEDLKRGELICVVETDKGVIDVEVFDEGRLLRTLVEPGTRCKVGTPLAVLESGSAAPVESAPAPVESAPVPVEPAPVPVESAPVPVESAPVPVESAPVPVESAPVPVESAPVSVEAAPAATVRASPRARARARELNVELAAVSGTGPDGEVTTRDVENAAGRVVSPVVAVPAPVVAVPVAPTPPRATPSAPRGERAVAQRSSAEAATAMRRAVAAAMTRAKREIPHYYLTETIDMSRPLAWLAEQNARRPVSERMLYAVLLIRAVAQAVREVPEMNGLWHGETFVPSERVHVGFATSLRRGGLIAPALMDADQKSPEELMRDLADLVKRARTGKLRNAELTEGTITITSLGEQGVEAVVPVISPPQVAIVGFGKIAERPWAEDGGLFVRPLIHASLAADHRVSDGHRGGLFLAAIARTLSSTEGL